MICTFWALPVTTLVQFIYLQFLISVQGQFALHPSETELIPLNGTHHFPFIRKSKYIYGSSNGLFVAPIDAFLCKGQFI